jgi:hypothetical protein
MKKGMIPVIRDVTKFLGKHLTELRILQLDDLLYIGNFREVIKEGFDGGELGKLVRKGQVGGWKDYFTEEKQQIWNDWIAKNLEGTDIKMTFE